MMDWRWMGQLVPTKAVLNWLLASALVAHSHPLSGAQQCTGRVPTVQAPNGLAYATQRPD